MRFGMNYELKSASPEKWADDLAALGVRATAFPLDYHSDFSLIDAYKRVAEERDIVIAEVGAWSNPLSPNKKEAAAAMEKCVEQLKLADHIGAKCCCNIAGAWGPKWDGAYLENFNEDFYQRTVDSIREIIDRANPKNTVYAIEPMPCMVPTGPDEYLKLIRDVDSPYIGVHLDMVNWMCGCDRVFHQQAFMDDVFAKLRGKIVSCHLKDFEIKQELTFQIRETPVGKGIFDIDYYVNKVEEEDPELPLMIEHLPSKLAYIKSMKYINQRFSALSGVTVQANDFGLF